MPSWNELQRSARMYLSRATVTSLAPPDWVSVNLTLRCNLKCTMCTTCYDTPRELSTAEIKDIIDQTALWGVRVFNPLGGEPFMRPDLEELLDYACSKDFYITLTTNGTLINRKRAEALARIPSSKLHINISLDGPEAVHDGVRGEGMFRRAIAGYRRLRDADRAAGRPRRKILANTIIHDRNLDCLPELLDDLEAWGFDGVQLLNLFRRGPGPPDEAAALWIHPRRFGALEALIDELVRRVRAQGSGGFRILNSERDLRLVLPYYRDDLAPLEAPCWSGWKELYINADGSAIMCDGRLDFLNGRFGDVRRQTLREIWQSPELAARREVVKSCSTPCMQSCYLRRDSDSARAILRGAAELLTEELRRRVRRRRRRGTSLPDGRLILELSDAAPRGEDAAARRNFEALVAGCPAPIERCYEDPFTWYAYRDRGYLSFDRGFMGFELVRKIVGDLEAAGLRFGEVQLSWRGEPLLHPELALILRWLLERIGDSGVFGGLRLLTDGRLLNTEIADIAAFHGEIPQTWILLGEAAAPWEEQVLRNVDYFLRVRRPGQRVIASWLLREPVDPFPFVETWRPRLRGPWLRAGREGPGGDGIWFRGPEPADFREAAAIRRDLAELVEVLDGEAAADLAPPDRPPRQDLPAQGRQGGPSAGTATPWAPCATEGPEPRTSRPSAEGLRVTMRQCRASATPPPTAWSSRSTGGCRRARPERPCRSPTGWPSTPAATPRWPRP